VLSAPASSEIKEPCELASRNKIARKLILFWGIRALRLWLFITFDCPLNLRQTFFPRPSLRNCFASYAATQRRQHPQRLNIRHARNLLFVLCSTSPLIDPLNLFYETDRLTKMPARQWRQRATIPRPHQTRLKSG
jgi:hypothetical protein